MKTTSRLLTLLLALALAFTLIPAVARAEESTPETENLVATIPFQINPLYEGILEESDLDIPEIAPEEIGTHAVTYVSKEKAAAQIRAYMKDRTETFTIYVIGETSNYNAIANELFDLAMQHTGEAEEGDYLLWQYGGWSGEVSRKWNSVNQYYEYTYTFVVPYYTTAEQEAEMDQAVTNLINSLGVRYKTDYEKVCAVYDWICANVTYDYANLEDDTYTLKHSAYAALINKTAVCQGYALLFYRLMLEMDVDNRLIAGLGNGGAHGWNIVELDNLYYNLDSTWDAGQETYNYFLRTEGTFGDHARYMDYATLDFLTTYPMSGKDYVKGEKSEPIDVLFGGQCGDDAYWEIDMDRELTIFGTGAVYDYPYSASAQYLPPWHYWEEELYTIVVEEGITVLGNYTFCDQINLTKVTLPSTLTEIRTRAFTGCEKLESINIPDGVTFIDGAFEGCGLTSIVIPDSVKDLDLRCFKDCVNLKTVVLGTGLTEIKYATFENCDSLTSITLPNTITYIDENAFYGCGSLKEITIPAGVQKMGRDSLCGCSNLTKVVFKGKTDLTSGVFNQYNEKLRTVYFYGTAPKFAYNTFFGLTVTCYYPKGSPSWTEEVRQQYEGNVTWVPMYVTCVEHDYEAVVTAPTCHERGYTTYTCGVCGESYVGDYTDTVPHTYEGTVTAPTCTEQGYTTYTCTICGDSYQADYTDTVAHDYANGFCTFCDSYEPAVLNGEVYEISNAGQLYWFAEQVNSGKNTIDGKLMADIVVNENVLNSEGNLNGGTFRAWTPIGTETAKYNGDFDGNYKTVSGLYFSNTSADYVGLFGYLDSYSTVKNMGILDSYLKGGDYVGALVGMNYGVVDSCYNEGRISGETNVGGISGCNEGWVETINGPNKMPGTVQYCYNIGAVSGYEFVGGVVGQVVYRFGNLSCGGWMYNSYYLDTCAANIEGSGTAMTAEQFASGEVAFLLGAEFGQTIGTDAYPVFGGEKVYQNQTGGCTDSSYTYAYSNTEEEPVVTHSMMPATCTEASYCSRCGIREGEPLGHDYREKEVKATCTEGGYILVTCYNCGDSYVYNETGALGHDYEAIVTEPTCQKGGYTTYDCTRCDDSYVDDYTDPGAHRYEDGNCIWCGHETYTIKWISGTTSLNGTIDLNIYVALSENLLDEEDAFVRFTHSGVTVDVPVSKGLKSEKNGTVCYRYSCEIFAKQVADTVTVQVMDENGQIGKTLNYSVMQYCVNQIEKSTDQKLVAVCKTLLNYAAAAQTYFNYNTENLANASLSEEDKALIDVNASDFAYAISGKEPGIRASSATLMLESEVKIRVYFQLTGDKTIEDYTFTIDGKEVAVKQNDKGYYIESDGIPAKNLDDMHQFCVGGITVEYGALSYVNSKVTSSKTAENERNLAKALYAYYAAAEALLG